MPDNTPQLGSADTIIKQILLEKLRVASRQSLAASVLEHAELYDMIDTVAGDMVLALETYVLAEELENHTREVKLEAAFDTPATWWQMLKRDHFPAWFLVRFPINYKTERQTKKRTVTFKKYATYPHSTAEVPPLGRPIFKTVVQVEETDDES